MAKRAVVGTSNGAALTDEEIEALAAEAARGYAVKSLRRRSGGRPLLGSAPAEVVPVRIDPEMKAAIDARAMADDTTTSEVIREALRRYLDVA